MKKILFAAFLSLFMLFPSAFAVDLYVDGGKIQTDVEPTIVEGRTLVPLRAIFEALDAEVEWDNATGTAIAQKDGKSVQVTIDNVTAYVDGKPNTLDVPARLINERTMVPARFVSESLDSCVLWDESTKTVYIITADHNSLVVEYLDVGQADSILLSCGGEYMLIDAGNNDDGNDVVNYLKNVGVDELKYVVGTHPHEDHIGGMDDVINSLDVQKVFLPNATTNTKTYSDVLAAIENKNISVTVPQRNNRYTLGDTKISVVAAQQANDLNNSSIVLKAVYGQNAFLFMGDAEADLENYILNSGSDIKCDVLKVAHHGADTSTSAAFIAKANPSAAIISCGAGNSYGHPSESTLNNLAGIPVWRTDLNGTVIAMTDGQDVHITANKRSASITPNEESTPTNPTQPSEPTQPSNPDTPSQPSTPEIETGDESSSIPSTVYITPTGKRYHYSSSCAGKNATSTTLSNAKSRGLTPCQKCAA